MCFNINVRAQEDEQEFFMGLNEGDELVWEVTELNEYYFRNTFTFLLHKRHLSAKFPSMIDE